MLWILVACARPDSVDSPAATLPDTGITFTSHPSGTFELTGLTPSEGTELGGTLVRVSGLGFSSATTVTIGGQACASLTLAAPTELFCVTPPGSPGDAQVEVTDGENTAALTFTYLTAIWDTAIVDTAVDTTVERCTLTSPLTIETTTDGGSVDVFADVVVANRTDLSGAPVGVDVQFGVGPTGSAPELWLWEDAYWEADGDGSDTFRDYWYPDDDGIFDFGFRVQVDHGAFTVCLSESGQPGHAIVTPPPEIPVEYCHLQWPCSTSVAAGDRSEDIYAWIYQTDVTMGEGEGEGLWLDIGVGPAGADPETSTEWAWYTMSYNTDTDGLLEGDLANDEYVGNFYVPDEVGELSYVARASADEGATWTICDLGGESCGGGGSSDGYDESTAGVCTVY